MESRLLEFFEASDGDIDAACVAVRIAMWTYPFEQVDVPELAKLMRAQKMEIAKTHVARKIIRRRILMPSAKTPHPRECDVTPAGIFLIKVSEAIVGGRLHTSATIGELVSEKLVASIAAMVTRKNPRQRKEAGAVAEAYDDDEFVDLSTYARQR